MSKYIPWFIANGSTQLNVVERLDVDRKNNAYLLTVRISRSKKGEVLEDILRVKHVGQCDIKLLIDYADAGTLHHRMFHEGPGNTADKPDCDYEVAREIRIRKTLEEASTCRS